MPASQKNPIGQTIHVFESVALCFNEYVPAAHATGAVIPEFAQKFPAGHGLQKASDDAPVVAENVPGGHNFSSFDARAQKVPGLHSLQLLLWCWLLFAEKVPAGHEIGSDDAVGQKYPGGHCTQSSADLQFSMPE
jgi:hypothetical protein